MPSKKHCREEIIGKLCEAEVVLAQGATTAEACRRIVISDRPVIDGARNMADLRPIRRVG